MKLKEPGKQTVEYNGRFPGTKRSIRKNILTESKLNRTIESPEFSEAETGGGGGTHSTHSSGRNPTHCTCPT